MTAQAESGQSQAQECYRVPVSPRKTRRCTRSQQGSIVSAWPCCAEAWLCSWWDRRRKQATTKLFSFLSREPIKGYKAVSLQQVVMAEKQMWVEAAHATVGQVLDTGSPKPVDTALDSPEVKQFLLFLPLPSENAHPKPGTKREATKPPPTASAPAKRQKGKSKGKGKGPSIPPGCVATLPTGERVCFGFNRCTCARQKDPACDRGKHVCWRSGCHGAHPGAERPNS